MKLKEKIVKKSNLIGLFLLFIISIIIIVINNSRTCAFVDFTYQLENAYRICKGQIPYKDFFLVLTPGTYYLLAGFLYLFHFSNIAQIVLVIIVQISNLFLTYLILKLFCKDRMLVILILIVCAISGQTTYPFVYYDYICILFMLLSVLVGIKIIDKQKWYLYVLNGMLVSTTFFFKQNYGLFFILAFHFFMLIYFLNQKKYKNIIMGILGSAIPFLLFLQYLLYNNSLKNYIYQTLLFPAQAKNVSGIIRNNLMQIFKIPTMLFIGVLLLLGILLCLMPICEKLKNVLLIVANTTFFVCYYYLYKTQIEISMWYFILLLLLIILFKSIFLEKSTVTNFNIMIGSIFLMMGGFLTHSIVAPIWIFALLICFIFTFFLKKRIYQIIVYIFLCMLIVKTSDSAFNIESQISWVSQEGEYTKFKNDNFKLFNIGTNGVWVSEMEELITFVKNTIGTDSFVQIPCEDPIYWATDTIPQLDFFQLYPETCPYNEAEIINKLVQNKIKWVIVKEKCQFKYYIINEDEILSFEKLLTKSGYREYQRVGIYRIYTQMDTR